MVYLAPVAQKVDNAINQINLYSLDSAIGFPNTYLLDSDSAIQLLNNWGLDINLLNLIFFNVLFFRVLLFSQMTSLMTILEDYFNWKGKKTVLLNNSLLWSIVTVYYFNAS